MQFTDVFPDFSVPQENSGIGPKISHDLFLPHSFHLIFRYHPLIRLHIIWSTDSVVK